MNDAYPGAARLGRRELLLVPAAFLLAGVVVGVVWWWRADPPTWVAVQGRGYLDEVQRTRAFGTVALYTGLSAVPALVLGAVVGWVLRWRTWWHVALLAVSSAVAAVVSWQVGLLLGPPDPRGGFADLADGTTVPGAVTLDAYGVLLVWPLGALLALVVVGVVLVPDEPSADADDEPSTGGGDHDPARAAAAGRAGPDHRVGASDDPGNP